MGAAGAVEAGDGLGDPAHLPPPEPPLLRGAGDAWETRAHGLRGAEPGTRRLDSDPQHEGHLMGADDLRAGIEMRGLVPGLAGIGRLEVQGGQQPRLEHLDLGPELLAGGDGIEQNAGWKSVQFALADDGGRAPEQGWEQRGIGRVNRTGGGRRARGQRGVTRSILEHVIDPIMSARLAGRPDSVWRAGPHVSATRRDARRAIVGNVA